MKHDSLDKDRIRQEIKIALPVGSAYVKILSHGNLEAVTAYCHSC